MGTITPGCKIVHKQFGEGIVTASDTFILVDFPSAPNVKLHAGWVETNCRIIAPEGKMKRQDLMMRLKSSMEQLIEQNIKSIVDNFKKFNFSEYGFKELENYFRFKLNYLGGHKKELRYNLLIQCNNDDEASKILKEFSNGLKKIGALKKKALIKKESDLREKLVDDGFPLECSMLGIYACEPLMKDSVKIVSSSIRGNLQLEKSKKDLVWKLIEECSNLAPDCTIIAIGPKGFVDYVRENDGLYYRFFAHRIIVKPMSEDNIIESMYRGIRSEHLVPTKSFKEAIETYIRVVYPKADLRDTAFVDDLLNRVFVNYYLSPSDKKLLPEHVPFYRKPKSFDEISEQLNQLIGLQNVKKQFRDIYMLSRDQMNINKQRLHFAFVGNPGTGKTTVARLTAELLYSMGLIKRNKLIVVSPTEIISVYKGESAQLLQEKIDEATGGVLFIDEAYFLTSSTSDTTSPQKQCLDLLIQVMENRSDELTVIFAGYSDEIDELLKSNPGIASRVPYRFVFEDYSNEELRQIFIGLASQEDMTLDRNAYDLLLDRISLAKTEENFGNARTIANIYQQLKVIWLEKGRSERVITADDIRESMPVALNADLDKMIGLDSVKRELKNFESRVKYIKYLKDKKVSVPAPNMHMIFTGNPGTGKTTVAHKIADCLYQIGILKTNKLIVAERKDLVGQFVGETAPKTSELIKKAMNGVLFIDEAYSLYKQDDPRDTGTEAITTLITAMENYKDCLVVIFAGYRNEMQVFQHANLGITSRIGFTSHFPDYTPDELTEMFRLKMSKNGFVIDTGALKNVNTIMEYFSKMDDFGNGRFVDKVIDMTVNNRAKRAYARKYNDILGDDIPTVKDLINVTAGGHLLWTDEEQSDDMRKRIAIHEAGHALVSSIVCPERTIKEITINADAASMGKAVVESDYSNNTEKSLKGQLAILFGGRNAERLLLGDHSAGCMEDISRAKHLANYMIDQLAMGDFGVTTEIDLLKEADKTAMGTLQKYKDKLEKLAKRLFDNGTIIGHEVTTFSSEN